MNNQAWSILGMAAMVLLIGFILFFSGKPEMAIIAGLLTFMIVLIAVGVAISSEV